MISELFLLEMSEQGQNFGANNIFEGSNFNLSLILVSERQSLEIILQFQQLLI